MGRTYNVIDADGHVLEPVDIWEKYMDPAYRDRAPRIIVDKDGKERLNIEGKILGSPKGLGNIGAIGARQGDVAELTMKYVEGRKGGFDPHARIPTTAGCCTTRTTRRSGPRWRSWTSPSASTKARAGACRRWASIASPRAGRGTSSPTLSR